MVLIHATCVAVDGVGVLLRGPAGSGKSDLALRLIDGGARLVADDQVDLRAEGARLIAAAPAPIAGLLEVRGLGPVPVPSLGEAEVGLIVDLVPGHCIERLPDPATCGYLGLQRPVLRLDPFQASTPAKLRLAVAARVAGPHPPARQQHPA
ncbi:MAG: hypothetical protein GVY13_00980 [Alphaproteobacteria bacterium]|jgi:hypothetical protein|nr:hypothetical protein [Alphaproteobacteria bacterium]